jgi:hypothetical protein
MTLKVKLIILLLLSTTPIFAQQSKKEVLKSINFWYDNHSSKYIISMDRDNAFGNSTRYHPERYNELNNLIEITYNQMTITLAFSKPLDSISMHKDSLQKYYSYVSLHNIYSNITHKGWDIHPRTPSSSLRHKGVKFTEGGDAISLTINWSLYAVIGYKNSKGCNEESEIMDMGISESCYVSIRKNLPLEIKINKIPIVLE